MRIDTLSKIQIRRVLPLLMATLMLALNVHANQESNEYIYKAFATHAAGAQQVVPSTDSPPPIIVSAINQIDRAKRVQELIGASDNSGEKNCTKCSKAIVDIKYGQCEKKNNYLEEQLQKLAGGNSFLSSLMQGPLRPQSIIKANCLKTSLEMGSTSARNCNGNHYGKSISSPCLSENYFKLITNSFDAVSMCMKNYIAPDESEQMKKLDVRAIYGLINIESGFQINAVSDSGAGGIGQFTSSAISDVNANHIPAVRAKLLSSDMPTCHRLSKELLDSANPIRSDAAASCERISLANGNPVKNMLYTFAYLRGAKLELDEQIFKNKNYLSKFSLSDFDLARIKRALMVWSHNTGRGGILKPTRSLLNSVYRNKLVTNAEEFIAQMQTFVEKFPSQFNNSSARRKETSRYFPKIENTLNDIESNAGGGTCLN